jgi:RNA recognition motif-containing protein
MNNTTKNSTVYISNLSYERDRNGIKSMFSKFGIIKDIKIIVEPKTNQSRGMAFVEMATVEEAKKAIEGLQGKIVDGRTVKTNWATPMKPGTEDRKFYPAKVDSKIVKPVKKAANRDLEFKDVQLAKKARNLAKKKANPLVFKAKVKAKTK